MIINKVKEVFQASKNTWDRDNWSWFRLYHFLISRRGRRKIITLIKKTFLFIFRAIFRLEKKYLSPYSIWKKRNSPSSSQLNKYKNQQKKFSKRPLISIILPVYNVKAEFLDATISSVLNQVYDNWELCISDDASDKEETINSLKKIQDSDPRIKVDFREVNGHISASSNSALALANGEYIALLDHDDLLSPDALYEMVLAINQHNPDLIYSDEDKVDEDNNRCHPLFKPQWSPDTFLTRNYIGHFLLVKHDLIKKINGFREGIEGSQDYDLLLRLTELTSNIHHIPKILYHWRMHEDSTSSNQDSKLYAFTNGEKALNDAFERRNVKAIAKCLDNAPGYYTTRYEIIHPPKVSIVIPSRNKADILSVCLSSIFELTESIDFEVIVINNNSDESSFFDLINTWKEKVGDQIKCIDDTGGFNFSRLVNNGVKASSGDYVLLLNNDTEVISKNWLHSMVEQAQRSSIGAVGAKLLYFNNTVQHAGVVIGLGEIAAGHTFVGAERDEPGYYNYLKTNINYSAVTAACLMVRKDLYLEVNGFDEEFTVEYNDIDFCLKLIDKGYRNIYLPHVELYHYESLTRGHPMASRKSYKRHKREVGLFQNKWRSYMENDPCYNKNLSKIYTHFDLNIND